MKSIEMKLFLKKSHVFLFVFLHYCYNYFWFCCCWGLNLSLEFVELLELIVFDAEEFTDAGR